MTTNYFGQSFESFKTIAVLVALILTNDELLIGIKDIRTIAGRICKGTESDRSNGVIDFGSNSRVTCYTPPGSTVVIDCLYTTTESTVGRYAVFICLRPPVRPVAKTLPGHSRAFQCLPRHPGGVEPLVTTLMN